MVNRLIKKIVVKFKKFQKELNKTEIEAYIASRYPQSAADVDRLTREYQFKQYTSHMV